jgi:hypothetical protein
MRGRHSEFIAAHSVVGIRFGSIPVPRDDSQLESADFSASSALFAKELPRRYLHM